MVEQIEAKSILQKVQYDSGQWFGIDYNINLYKGCCHGCIYCDSRSDCYRIEQFDKVRIKKDAIAILQKELYGKKKKGVIGLGAMSDTYNPFEEQVNATRDALRLIERYGFGVSIDTKGTLITRDIDYLQKIAGNHSAIAKITITTADDALAAKIEPRAPKSSQRFQAVKELSDGGIFCGVLMMPVLPFLGDTIENVKAMVELAAEHHAKFIYPGFGMTMRDGQREHFLKQLKQIAPELPEKYIQKYDSKYQCTSPKARECWNVFEKLCEQYGILYRMNDIIKGYQRVEGYRQMSLFD